MTALRRIELDPERGSTPTRREPSTAVRRKPSLYLASCRRADGTVVTILPDASTTTLTHGFGPDRTGATQFQTTVTDANVNANKPGAVKTSYRDVRDLITSVKERHAGTDLWTSYRYDALKQIVEVKDHQDNLTKVAYDHFGRRTSIDNPDTGRTDYAYDLASNLTAKVTANLKAANQALTYNYDFTRLTAIAFPANPRLNVRYTYGAPGSPHNTAGRLTKVVSHTTQTAQGPLEDSEERKYGKLGEVTYEKKTVVTYTSPLSPSVFETTYKYDTFGRLLTLTYPDGEVLTNTYDSGGNLQSTASEKNGFRYRYLLALQYDKFEQRVQMEQGNGVKTAYAYDPKTRRLATLTAGKGTLFQNLQYGYDPVGNILALDNQVPVPTPNSYGGPVKQTFTYDELHRLTKAQGTFQHAPDKTHTYTLDLTYDTIHNLVKKTQVHNLTQPSGVPIPQKKTSYDWSYTYNPSGPTSTRPHAPLKITGRTYSHDPNGNQTAWTHDTNGTQRTLVWDEENRLQTLADQGHTHYYKYDAEGQRTIKRGPQGETVYVNQFYTQRPGATGSKHVYAGTSRIATKLLRQDVPGANPQGKTPYEKDLYFYHPDHLGSSSYVTDLNGRLYEHLQYFPFGETWVAQNSNVQRTPYLFTSKELDEETQLYYFGARYYDPRTSVWQSADPILGKYLPTGNRERDQNLPGMGGIYNARNLGLYTYGHQNPVVYSDPDGRSACLNLNAVPFVGRPGAIGCVLLEKGGEKLLAGLRYAATALTGATVASNINDDEKKNDPPSRGGMPTVPVPPIPPEDPEGEKGSPVSKPLYRGGELRARPQDVKIDPQTGLVRPTHGVSLSESASAVEKFGGARQVTSAPKELQIIQRGKPGHYEIVPRQPMTFERYQELLKKVTLE